MTLNNVQYNFIIRTYEEKQDKNRHLLEKRRAYIYEHVDGYKELEDSIASISVEHGKKLLSGDDSALDDLKTIIKNFSESKTNLLVSYGYPSDYLEPVYDCPDCKDTGYIDGQKCHCFRQFEISMLYEQSHISKMLQHENFSNLSYEYYKDDDLVLFMDAVNTCKKFIENFESIYQNLFFYGTVGSGKSFLSGCVAKELIEKGRSVLYFSSSSFFETLSQLTYGFRNKNGLGEACDDIYNCDLLIIDDLGAEVTGNYTSSQLFSCLNERHIRHKSTVISTNLSLEELRVRYSDRIFSRITSNYTLCKLSGPDIRIYKKLNRAN